MNRTMVLLGVLAIASCTSTDPLTRDGLWQPSGANEANLAAMVADPADLVRGKEAEGSDGQRAAAAVARLRLDRVKPLPDSGIAQFTTTGTGAPATGGALPATGETP
ncbi:MAG: CpaD family pilus assembly lipoprotein [Janthinobacterium lividum]